MLLRLTPVCWQSSRSTSCWPGLRCSDRIASRRTLTVFSRSGSTCRSTQSTDSTFTFTLSSTGASAQLRCGWSKAALGGRLPHLPEARDLVRDPYEVADIVAHGRIFDGEEERDVREIVCHQLLGVAVERPAL